MSVRGEEVIGECVISKNQSEIPWVMECNSLGAGDRIELVPM